MKKISLLCTFISSVILTCFSQDNPTLYKIDTQYQACLDKGKNMLACAQHYYQQMDSLLNISYKQLRSTCDSLQKENLKDEQREWLQRRDAFFKKTGEEKIKGVEGGEDELMIKTDKKTLFVKDRVLELLNKTSANYSPGNYKVVVTGSYKMDVKTETRNGDTYGYFGTVKVKALGNNKILLKLWVCKGAPSYNIGTAMDTLTLRNNVAVYKTPENDSSCRIIFTFFRQGIKVQQISNELSMGCGFGYAVFADGFYRRTSGKTPDDKEFEEL